MPPVIFHSFERDQILSSAYMPYLPPRAGLRACLANVLSMPRRSSTIWKSSSVRALWVVLGVIVGLIALPTLVDAQSPADSGDSSFPLASAPAHLDFYARPTETMKLRKYFFDGFGPYPISVAAVSAGISQIDDSPPDWKQGAAAYGKRFASSFGVLAVTATTRYTLAEAFHEDTLYYRCECKGVFRRLGHAVISTVLSRRGDDGHRVFSFPGLVAPYAGSMTAIYGWYPRRYDAMDGFRMGNYNMLGYVGANITLEFFHTGPRSWISRMHLNNEHGAQIQPLF
jgi:hypothetical protein